MVSGTHFIYAFIERNSDIRRNLARGIINTRALAKFILLTNPHLDLNLNGALTAIRRYAEENQFEEKKSSVDKIFENTKLEMSFGKVIMHLKKTEHALRSLTGLFDKLNLISKDGLNVMLGRSTVTLVFDDELYPLIFSDFQEDILHEVKNVGQITLRLDPAVLDTPNVFATVITEIGLNDINVIDSITKRGKFFIYVKDKEVVRTCNVLYKFTNEANQNMPETNNKSSLILAKCV